MTRPLPRTETQRLGRTALARVLVNGALLAFASLAVIALFAGDFAAAMLWFGALLVFFAPALDRSARLARAVPGRIARRADGLRWFGLAFAAAGAAWLLA